MLYVVYTIHVVTCLFLILVVLLQQGKGADLSVFGGGSTQAAFGARGAATLLHKMTVFGFVAFIFTTMAIGFLQKGGSGDSVMSTVTEGTAATEPEAEPDAETGSGQDPCLMQRPWHSFLQLPVNKKTQSGRPVCSRGVVYKEKFTAL